MNIGVLMEAYSGADGAYSLREKGVSGTEGWLGALVCAEESGTEDGGPS